MNKTLSMSLAMTAALVAIAGGVSLRTLHAASAAGEPGVPVASTQEGVVQAEVTAYLPSIRADVVAYDDLGRAYATARCGHGFGPCPGDQNRAMHLSSRDPTVGF